MKDWVDGVAWRSATGRRFWQSGHVPDSPDLNEPGEALASSYDRISNCFLNCNCSVMVTNAELKWGKAP